MLVMLRARLSVASDFGNLANRPASSHGSLPSRANTETRLRVMPFASVPTGAKRNSFNPDCRKAKASVLGMLSSHDGMNPYRVPWGSIQQAYRQYLSSRNKTRSEGCYLMSLRYGVLHTTGPDASVRA